MFDELPSSISVPPSLRGGIELKAYCLSLIAAAARRAAASPHFIRLHQSIAGGGVDP
jgi:hypothetical protein